MNIIPLKDWAPNPELPLVISGPCSAESEEQLFQTCTPLSKDPRVQVLRAGIWKPRTRPGTFEGHGEEALKWFQKVKTELKMPISCEVANASHVELALKYGVDILWIGARTTVNPFAVQEIADSLRGVDIPILVKNPINPDFALWCGAMERLNKVGVTKLGAIHRGFNTYEKTNYRNVPLWEIPIELKRKFPEIPIIADPSHIAGKREFITRISQKAFDLDFNGLMIETHINPAVALSDAEQQLTPQSLKELLDVLELRFELSLDEDFEQKLNSLRFKIDRLDTELLELLSKRIQVSADIGAEKRKQGVTALQVHRMDQMLKDRVSKAQVLGLKEKYINDLYHVIHAESVRVQAEVMRKKSDEKESL